MEQPDAEILLQGVDLVADGRRRNVELSGGLAEAHMAGRRLKRAQGAQGRQMAVHIG